MLKIYYKIYFNTLILYLIIHHFKNGFLSVSVCVQRRTCGNVSKPTGQTMGSWGPGWGRPSRGQGRSSSLPDSSSSPNFYLYHWSGYFTFFELLVTTICISLAGYIIGFELLVTIIWGGQGGLGGVNTWQHYMAALLLLPRVCHVSALLLVAPVRVHNFNFSPCGLAAFLL